MELIYNDSCLIKPFLDFPNEINYQAEICQGDTYTLNGFNTSIEGIHAITYGCDSIIRLNLRVNPIYKDTITADICQGETYNQNGFNENNEGFYTLNLQSFNGCDSILYLDLEVNPIYKDTIKADICQGEIYNQNGFNENTTGFYIQNLQSYHGCDSILYLDLKVNPIYKDTIIADICQGETYNQNGFNENAAGFYTLNLQSYQGCDSILYLDLKVRNVYDNIIFDTFCDGEQYSNYGFISTQSGVFVKNLQSIYGCDSIITLNLSQKKLFEDYSILERKYIEVEDYPIIIDVSCDGCVSYFWNTGSTNPKLEINYPGSYYVSIYTGCGTIYDSLLVVSPEIPLFLPNSFTPTLDNNNTFFPIYSDTKKVTIELFEIYNRWGERIYSSTSIPWDGKYQNDLVPTGVYVWQLVYKTKYSGDTTYKKSGYIHLIR